MNIRANTRRAGAGLAATVVVALAVTGVASAGGSGLPRGSEPVKLDPADFTTRIDNPYWPMRPGNRWVYRETDSEGTRQRVVVTVTRRTKLIANGVTARVVRDVVTEKRQAGREDRRLVRPGQGREHLVPGRVHHGVRER